MNTSGLCGRAVCVMASYLIEVVCRITDFEQLEQVKFGWLPVLHVSPAVGGPVCNLPVLHVSGCVCGGFVDGMRVLGLGVGPLCRSLLGYLLCCLPVSKVRKSRGAT